MYRSDRKFILDAKRDKQAIKINPNKTERDLPWVVNSLLLPTRPRTKITSVHVNKKLIRKGLNEI